MFKEDLEQNNLRKVQSNKPEMKLQNKIYLHADQVEPIIVAEDKT